MKLLLKGMTAATVSGRHLIKKHSVDFEVKAVVDCLVDIGRCDKTGNEVKKFAKTAVCMPRSVSSSFLFVNFKIELQALKVLSGAELTVLASRFDN